MFTWLKRFFLDAQTFSSAMGDLAGVVAVAAASPEVLSAITNVHPLLGLVIPAVAYGGGVVSGRKTGPTSVS